MSEQILNAGFHKMKVEPPMGIHVPGYYEKRSSDGFLTDLASMLQLSSKARRKSLGAAICPRMLSILTVFTLIRRTVLRFPVSMISTIMTFF